MKAVTLKYTVQTVNEWRAGYSESCKSGSGASVRKPTAAMRQGAGYLAYLTPFLSLTAENTTTLILKSKGFVMYPTESAGNTACRLSKNRIKHHQGKYGWMRKAESRHATMCIGKMSGKRQTSAAALTIWRSICGEKDISPTLRESIGRYACRSMNTSQGLIPLMRNGRRITSKEIWERTQDTETAEQRSPIRPKCRRTCEAGLNLSKRQVISIVFICTTAICWAFYRRKQLIVLQVPISKRICGSWTSCPIRCGI